MASIAIMIGGAILNATAFIGGSYIAKSLTGNSGEAMTAERKRHDLALEKYNNDLEAYQKKKQKFEAWQYKRQVMKKEDQLDFQTTDEELKYYNSTHKQKDNFTGYGGDGDDDGFEGDHPPPVFSDYYKPAKDQRDGELLYIGGGMLTIGYLASRFI